MISAARACLPARAQDGSATVYYAGDIDLKLVDGAGTVERCVVLKGRVEEGVAWEGEAVEVL